MKLIAIDSVCCTDCGRWMDWHVTGRLDTKARVVWSLCIECLWSRVELSGGPFVPLSLLGG